MGTVRYYDNNLGVQLNGDMSLYLNTQLTPDRMVMTYDEVGNGPIDDWLPYTIRFVVEDGVVETFETGPQAGQWDYTAGTLTKVKLFNADGDLVMEIDGLDLSMPYVSAMVFYNGGWNAVNHILGQGHTYYGSDRADPGDPYAGDSIHTGHGNDVVYAGRGHDWINDAGGKDVYRGGGGEDTVTYNNHTWALPADTDGIVARLDRGYIVGTDGIRDRIYSIERVQGSMFDDRMIGDGGENRFEGLGGNDFFNGRGGWDIVRFDDRDYLGGVQGVVVNMATGTARDAWGNTDTFTNIEEVRGSNFEDELRDDAGDNILRGEEGDDLLISRRGNDRFEGGLGADTFSFRGDNFGNDEVEDFEDGTDMLEVTGTGNFGALTIVDDGGDTLIQWNGNEIRLWNVSSADITADDFVF